jgi:magnesium chelatase subunit D
LLDTLLLGGQPVIATRSEGRAGASGSSSRRGRPAGSRPGKVGGGERLNVVDTLRAAAPWQPLRRRERAASGALSRGRIDVRPEDFRIARFRQRSETSVIFSVDASGSSALQRLAEAKGAVEQILADCYVRRDHVSLIAFRGNAATLLLPPTRSLVRVRRCLADLAGGGTTPISAGIDAALALALDARKRGHTPVIVLMTDGRANVARDGSQVGSAATDATSSATAVRVAGVRALFLDTAPRPRPEARALSVALGARYVPLPYVDAAGISRHVQALAAGVAP